MIDAPKLSPREKWALAAIVAAGIIFRLVLLNWLELSIGGTTFYYREVVRGIQERGEIGLYPYRPDAFELYPEVIQNQANVDRRLEDYGIRMDSDTRFMEWTPLVRYPPGFPIFLYAAHSALGDKAVRVVVLMILLNGVMIALTFPVAWTLFGRRDAAWIATVLNAFWIYTAKNSVNYMPEPLLFPLIMASAYACLRAWKTGSWGWTISLSALVFLCTTMRADTMGVLLFLPLALFFRNVPSRERLLKPAVAVMLALALWIPWSYRNYKCFGVFHPFPAGAGHNILIALGRYAPESGLPPDDRVVIQEEFGRDYDKQKLWASDVTYPNGIERDRARLKRAKDWIRGHPARFVQTMFTRLPYFFFTEQSAVEKIRVRLKGAPRFLVELAVWIARLIEPVAMILACVGVWIRRHDRKILVPVLLLLGYILPHMPLWVEARYFRGAWPVVLILAAGGALALLGRKEPEEVS